MPIYEFYCSDCNMIFNFYSKSINTDKNPICPKCKAKILTRQMSVFAVTGRAEDSQDKMDIPFDDGKIEQAMRMLASEAEHINENDPKQAADLMRKLTHMTGMELGPGMQEALSRMEQGEDPDKIETEMGDLLEGEDPFQLPEKKAGLRTGRTPLPLRDETLYDL